MAANNVFKSLKGKVRLKEPLKKHTTFRIGGPAQFFIESRDSQSLKLFLGLAGQYKIPVLVIGEGSNILVSDRGVKAAVLKLSSPFFKKVSFDNNRLTAGGGLPLGQLLRRAQARALSGVEFLVGIPGTVGGALVMNAGAWGETIGNLVEKVQVMDYNGRIKVLNKKQMRFGYRKSSLAKFIILSVRLRLCKKDRREIRDTLRKYLELRKGTQDYSAPNAGCIFRNPKPYGAGRLIEMCGLKGKRCQDAVVSKKHANFILNRGTARCRDVLKLMALIERRVWDKFNIRLKPEIKIWI
jgi:UDP-N-acetylmuramate dehydrogenase